MGNFLTLYCRVKFFWYIRTTNSIYILSSMFHNTLGHVVTILICMCVCFSNCTEIEDDCDACPVGSYAENEGMAECELCGYGKYMEEEGKSTCNFCPPGNSSLQRGHLCAVYIFVLQSNASVNATLYSGADNSI